MTSPALSESLERDLRRYALSPAQQAPLWREYRRRPTPELRERLALANLRLVAAVAGGWRGPPDLDALQDGVLGLLRAVEKYDPARGPAFSTCAIWWIRAGIGKGKLSPGLRPSAGLVSQSASVLRASAHLSTLLGHEATPAEVAAWLDRPLSAIQEALAASRAMYRPADLDSPTGRASGRLLSEVLAGEGDPAQEFERAEERHAALLRVRDAVARLDRRSRYVFAQRLLSDDPPTLAEVARELMSPGKPCGVSRERVRQILRVAQAQVVAWLAEPPRPLSAARRRLLLERWDSVVALQGPDLLGEAA